jgi:hypothetical protein
MKKICVLIRVYDRVEDLDNCIKIIKGTWTHFEYYILLVSNGGGAGFYVSNYAKQAADNLIELNENAGHLKGNAQLLLEGVPYIPETCHYTIILEADTWLYGDDIVIEYVKKLTIDNAVWASARWYNHLYSLATDFAIINTAFLKSHSSIFEYTGFPECYVANYLLQHNKKFIYIRENMMVHLPNYMSKYPFAIGNRFNVFLKSKMVTHHIELLKGGMQQKKMIFNTLAGVRFFFDDNLKPNKSLKIKIKIAVALSYLLPSKRWIMKTKQAPVSKPYGKI